MGTRRRAHIVVYTVLLAVLAVATEFRRLAVHLAIAVICNVIFLRDAMRIWRQQAAEADNYKVRRSSNSRFSISLCILVRSWSKPSCQPRTGCEEMSMSFAPDSDMPSAAKAAARRCPVSGGFYRSALCADDGQNSSAARSRPMTTCRARPCRKRNVIWNGE